MYSRRVLKDLAYFASAENTIFAALKAIGCALLVK
jgi:hypothetical protein